LASPQRKLGSRFLRRGPKRDASFRWHDGSFGRQAIHSTSHGDHTTAVVIMLAKVSAVPQ
jgi:hypothetical protein